MQDLIKKLDEAAKQLFIAKQNLAYKTALEAIKNPGTLIVCGKESGRGKYASSQSWQARTVMLLGYANIQFTTSNVAPKGGKAGDRITVSLAKPDEQLPKPFLMVGNLVGYSDNYGDRVGTVIEVNLLAQRARIKWDGRKLRTWMRFSALYKILQ